MTDWKPIATFDQADNVVVDLWIELPPDPDNYMQGRGYRIPNAYRVKGKWFTQPCKWVHSITDPITHWMPLPQAPNKEGA
jgi:hypothetical protein